MAQCKRQARNRILLASLAVLALHAEDAGDIVRRAQDRDFDRFDRLKDYTYIVRRENRHYDRFGKLTSRDVKTFECVISNRRPSLRLIAKNDKPLSEREARKAREESDRRMARVRYPSLGAARRSLDGFTYHIDGVEEIEGRPTWVISAESIFLQPFHIKRWIDQATYQLVKYESEHRIRANVNRVSFENVRVDEDVWLPSHSTMRSDLLDSPRVEIHSEMEVTYKDYKKFQSDDHVVAIEEPGR